LSAGEVETHGAFGAVEIIVQTALRGDKQGRRHAQNIELNRQIAFEKVLDLFDGELGLTEAQK